MYSLRVGNILSLFNCAKTSRINYGSALFVTGQKATEVCAIINPHIDFEERLSNIDVLKEIVKKRNKDLDVDNICDVWNMFKTLKDSKRKLEEKNLFYIENMKKMTDSFPNYKNELEKIRVHVRMIKEDLKALKPSLWSVEETAAIHALAFPNVLHPRTKDSEADVFHEFMTKPTIDNVVSHIDVATKGGLLQFNSPHSYYLKKDAAIFELCGKYYFSENLKKADFIQWSNPDFVKSLIVEGCGLSHTDPDCVFILHHNEDTKFNEDMRLHLVGGGSLLSFAAYHAKNVIGEHALPLKYFSLGRQYKPVPMTSDLGLFQVSQSSVAEIFIVLKDTEFLDKELDGAITLVREIYESLGFHFRICYSAANQIEDWESLRVSFQMFSPALDRYIEVGNISVSDDYISKRLQLVFREGKISKFPKIISGTVLSIPKLLGCILEHNSNKDFQIPPIMRSAL